MGRFLFISTIVTIIFIVSQLSPAQSGLQLPPGVRAVWEINKAQRVVTPARERICINGLWRWQPVKRSSEKVPSKRWGYNKVHGPWPGTRHWMHRKSQRFYPHPDWKDENLNAIHMAWYQREITIPENWAGRRITLYAEYIYSYAVVYIDGRKRGEMHYPRSEVDLTSSCLPGKRHLLSLYMEASPLKKDGLKRVQVDRRGLCGDVFLVSTPAQTRIDDVKVETSIRKWRITFDTAVSGLGSDNKYRLIADIKDNGRMVKKVVSKFFTAADLKNGRLAFTSSWTNARLWDIHTPQNVYDVRLSLLDMNGDVRDVFQTVRFGFREFWIEGRDFRLNGSRLFCFAVPLDNAQIGAAWASYAGAYETMARLKSIGVNLVYTHNYGCKPGSHLSLEEIFQAADDLGMLISLALPHAASYNWKSLNADETNAYAGHVEFYIRMAQNHPSVVMYSMNHNMLGYAHDMNPDLIDGFHNNMGEREPRIDSKTRIARRTEDIVKQFDRTRLIYHHSSGNFGQIYTSNFYLNFVPIQERSDWFEHWASEGIKPLFLCEYGAPLAMSWTLHRGWENGKWYQGKKYYTNGKLQYQFCTAEWGSQFLGDTSYKLTEQEKSNIRFEARQWRKGISWYRWDYPFKVHEAPVGISNIIDVMAMYITDNWRAYRTWGVSAFNIWCHGDLWKLKENIDRKKTSFAVDWNNLQKPGFSPDFIDRQFERMDTAYDLSDWIITNAGRALLRNNQPRLAYIGGKPARFTSKDHNFYAGETVEKQIIIINNSRKALTCDCSWSFDIPMVESGRQIITVETGEIAQIPLQLSLPDSLAPGKYALNMTARFSSGDIQEDSFRIYVLPRPNLLYPSVRIALFDPQGQTGHLLQALRIPYELVDASEDHSRYDILIIGKEALTVDGPAPDMEGVPKGLKVIVFEQKADVFEKRFGFRVQEYGLRRVFKRLPDHPILAGLDAHNLCNFRGQATIAPPRLEYDFSPHHFPTIKWCGLKVTRGWRCDTYGNVATVLIEKPTRGDFLSIVDGGFNLQYSPLLEYREGMGMILFCQIDVTGRTELDPVSMNIVNNILKYVLQYSPQPRRNALYVGDPAGRHYFKQAGISLGAYESGMLKQGKVLIVGPGGGKQLANHRKEIIEWLKEGGHILTIGLDDGNIRAFLPLDIEMKKEEHICAYFDSADRHSLIAGIGPAEVCIRDPRELTLVSKGALVVGNGVLALGEGCSVVFCQLVPWQFDQKKMYHTKISFRRTAFLVNRLLSNMGISSTTPLLARFSRPVKDHWYTRSEKRWLQGFYLDRPVEMDDPYRFFRW
jgi:beta-galactosidase